ncbi:hypothetical protein Hamer_G002255 [Homarus americanus]|uniref:Uncharacterized protein n=1 Tax=Homarus americanus TaxID=6706 RepID=A0A8J5MTV4_HOMAM|nr:hypothetical protein Hamer_G002255 [Homarus americanus]
MARSVDPTRDTSPAEPPPMKRNKFFALTNRSSTPRPTPSLRSHSTSTSHVYTKMVIPLTTGRPNSLSFPSSPDLHQSTWPFLLHRLLWNDCSPLLASSSGQRCNLSDKRFEQLMLIRRNPR